MEKHPLSATLSVYIPKKKNPEKLMERLQRIAEHRDRSINYIVIEAISEYLEKSERV